MKYEIEDIERCAKILIEAHGVAEAMLDYLPWPTMDLKIRWVPANGVIEATDIKTDFLYRIRVI
jgi:hypothetical protein